MCGAFSVLHPFRELGRPFNAGYNGPEASTRLFARPGQILPVILNTNPGLLQMAFWGISPAWSKGRAIINTRKESLDTKPTFIESFRSRRCIIPADGFYEWVASGNKKIPYLFRLKTQEVFGFAGIWQEDPKTKAPAFTIITTTPNLLVNTVHDRMPAILPPHQETAWIDSQTDPLLLMEMLGPFPADLMEKLPA